MPAFRSSSRRPAKTPWQKTGALGFVGQNEFEVGFKAGEQRKAAGVERVACLNPAGRHSESRRALRWA